MKVLVLILDSLPLGFLGCYGNDWIDTPALDRIAAEGVVFDRHYSDCPDAAAARRAWRTGRYEFPLAEGVTTAGQEDDWTAMLRAAGITEVHAKADANAALAESLAAALDRTAAADQWLLWLEAASLLPPWNVPDDLFQRYAQVQDEGEAELPPATPHRDLPTGRLAIDDDDAFLRLQSTYGALVAQLDEAILELLDELQRKTLLDDILLWVTTDRGLALGEHGVVGDVRPWLRSELVHLPLLARWPGGAVAGRRVSALTQPVDLMPTLLAAFGLKPGEIHGHNLLPWLRNDGEPIRPFTCTALQLGNALEWSLRTPEWSFLLPVATEPDEPPRGPQLYVLPDDRWEMNNVIQHHPELAEELERTLRAFVQAPGNAASLAKSV